MQIGKLSQGLRQGGDSGAAEVQRFPLRQGAAFLRRGLITPVDFAEQLVDRPITQVQYRLGIGSPPRCRLFILESFTRHIAASRRFLSIIARRGKKVKAASEISERSGKVHRYEKQIDSEKDMCYHLNGRQSGLIIGLLTRSKT